MAFKLRHISPGDPPNVFPSTQEALHQPNGLLAVGGDLSPERLVYAYSRGIFPWFSHDEPILWWSPNPRTVFLPGQVHASRRLQRRMRRQDYAVTLDCAFNDVIDHCAQPRRNEAGTWLVTAMREAYCELHRLGFAHSIEVWQRGELAGGLYGVSLGRAFFGESMFSRSNDMSKIALVLLARQLEAWGFLFLDGQVSSPHLYRMGATDMTRPQFEKLLRRAVPTVPQPARPARWQTPASFPTLTEQLPPSLKGQL